MTTRWPVAAGTGETDSAWSVARIERRSYELAERHPLRVTTKLNLPPSAARFDVHYALELGIVLTGEMTRLYQGHQRCLHPGDVWLCGPWEPHGCEVSGGPCSVVVVMIFPPMLATSTFPELPSFDWLGPFMLAPETRPVVPPAQCGAALALALELSESQKLPEPQRCLVQRMLIYRILLLLPSAECRDARASSPNEYARLHPAIELVVRNRRYVKLDEAARACRMSARTFSRSFQRTIGSPFHAFSTRHRVQGAALQLLEGSDPIKAIAREWGFFDASHLHQAFRAEYGCSPTVYRAQKAHFPVDERRPAPRASADAPEAARDPPLDVPLATDRHDLLGGGALPPPAELATCKLIWQSSSLAATAGPSHPLGRRLKAAFVNTGLANSWPAQGKAATEQWAKSLGVDVTWYDGGLSIDKQRKAVEDMASRVWDFVAIQAYGIDTLVDPVAHMIGRGIPVVQMDTMISENDPGVLTFLEPDHEGQGEQVASILCNAIGGQGTMIMTQGALGHSGTRKLARGFRRVVEQFPGIQVLAEDSADWDVNKTAQLWEDYLLKYPQIDAAFFHCDDMSLAAAKVIKNAGRNVKLGSIDAMPEAIEAVKDGRLFVTVRSSSARIHWGALLCGALAAVGRKVPSYIRTDGPVVTKEMAEGMAFLEEHYLV